MRRRMMRAFLVAAAAGGTLLMMGAAPALAGNPVPNAPIPTTSQAGYVATQNTFRYVVTTFTVPAASPKYTSYAEVVLGGTSGYPATLGVRAGGGTGSIEWNVVGPLGGMGGGTMKAITPKVGDTLIISAYYNQATGRVNFGVTDVTQGVKHVLSLPATPHQSYNAAEVACLLTTQAAAPKADVLLWEMTSTHVTTLAGTRGSMNGPWLTRQIVDVAADGHVVMSPSYLWNNGQNFGTWLRAAK